jgi:predicted metal-dependent peptidase
MKNLNEAKERLSVLTTLMLSGPDGYPRPFYGQFLMRMNKIWTDKIPTAGVSITDTVNFYINPDFLLKLNVQEAMDLIEHEILHVVYLHPLRSKELGDDHNSSNHKLHNVAADAKVNEGLKHITVNQGVTTQRLNDQLKQKGSKDVLHPDDSSEQYYWILKKNQDIDDEDGSGYGESLDDHGQWSESVANEAMAKAVVSQTGNAAAQAAGIGNTPSEMLKQLQRLSKSLVNWKQQLRQFFANALKHDHMRTRNRRNRRYGLLQSGKKKKQKLKIAMCMDSSGSVSDEAFAQIFSELDSITASGDVEVICIDADCQVAAVYDYKKGMKAERKGGGGTAYNPAINKSKELKVDGIIYAGDMDSADTPENPKMPFLWLVINSQSKPPGDFGKTVYVTTGEER